MSNMTEPNMFGSVDFVGASHKLHTDTLLTPPHPWVDSAVRMYQMG